jgi:secreted trypsin-like serine protease
MRLRRLALAVVAAATCAAIATPATAINSYNARPSDRAEVGTLIVQWWSDSRDGWRVDWVCSGAMVDADTFLTAAHCVTDWGSKPPQFFISLDPDVEPASAPLRDGALSDDEAAAAVAALTSPDGLEGVHAIAGTEHYSPGYPGTGSNAQDIAVVELPAGPVADRWQFEPAQLPTAGELTALGSRTLDAATWTVAGYGTQEATRDPDRAHSAGGVRLEATLDFNALNATWVRLAMNESRDLGGACYGDSGGPNYVALGDRELLAGLTVTGDAPCYATNVAYRTDSPKAQAFLEDYVELN